MFFADIKDLYPYADTEDKIINFVRCAAKQGRNTLTLKIKEKLYSFIVKNAIKVSTREIYHNGGNAPNYRIVEFGW